MAAVKTPLTFSRASAALAALLLGACGEKPAVPSAPAETATPLRPSTVPLADIGMARRELPASLEAHTWDTEHLNDAAGHQLKALGKLLAPGQANEAGLSALLTLDSAARRCARRPAH
jgi:hypothetical protein